MQNGEQTIRLPNGLLYPRVEVEQRTHSGDEIVKALHCTAKRSRVNRKPIRYEVKTELCKQTKFHTGLEMAIRYEMNTVSFKWT